MNTIEKGFIGETKVAIRAIEKGCVLSKPLLESRYDYILDDKERLYRVQVKYVDHVRTDTGSIQVDLRSECRNSGYRRLYDSSEIDVVLAYIAPLDLICWIDAEIFSEKTVICLRTEPAKNGQIKGIHMIEEFVW